MRTFLKYQKLPKEFGGWRFGLQFSFGVCFNSKEEEELTNLKLASIKINYAYKYGEVSLKKGTQNISLPTQASYADYIEFIFNKGYRTEDTWWFLKNEHREKFIEILNNVYQRLKENIQQWMKENAYCPGGEPVEIEEDVYFLQETLIKRRERAIVQPTPTESSKT